MSNPTKYCTMLTADFVRSLLDYDPETGDLTWKVKRTGFSKKGGVAGTIEKNGYRRIPIKHRNYLAHRLAWLHFYGQWPSLDLDHANGCRADNRIKNLRLATRSQNRANSQRSKRHGAGVKGAYLDPRTGRWYSSIRVNNAVIKLGRFDSREEAHAAYSAAAQKFHGEFARTE